MFLFKLNHIGILAYNREISECIFILYDNNQEYKEYSEILTQVHVDNNKLFSQLVNFFINLCELLNCSRNFLFNN